jgi:hypothetical protein
VALAVTVLLLVLLVLAQVLLPRVAADRVRDKVAVYGQVRSVHVSAFPAFELLWGSADSVSISARRLTVSPGQVASLLSQARGLGALDVAADAAVLRAALLPRGLEVGAVRVRKRGSSLSASATLTPAQLADALPPGVSAEPIAGSSEGIEARATGGLFGFQASLNVLVQAVEGRLVAEPRDVPFGGLAAVTLFSDPHLKVLGVALRTLRSAPLSYEVTLRAQLS